MWFRSWGDVRVLYELRSVTLEYADWRRGAQDRVSAISVTNRNRATACRPDGSPTITRWGTTEPAVRLCRCVTGAVFDKFGSRGGSWICGGLNTGHSIRPGLLCRCHAWRGAGGFFQNDGSGSGAIVGGLAGILATIPFVILLVAFILYGFGWFALQDVSTQLESESFFIGLNTIITVVSVFAFIFNGICGVLGGIIGGSIAS